MHAVHPHVGLRFDDGAQALRQLARQARRGGGIGHQRKLHAARVHALEIAHGLLDQFGIAHDDLLAAVGADAGGFQADILDLAGGAADIDGVAHLERLVDGDRQRGEQIAKDVLCRQRHGDAADAETGNEGGDVDTQVRQHGQAEHGPQHDLDGPDDQRVRHRGRRIGRGVVMAEITARHHADRAVQVQRQLKTQRDEPQVGQPLVPLGVQIEQGQADQHRGDQHGDIAGARQRRLEQFGGRPVGTAVGAQGVEMAAKQDDDAVDDDEADDGGRQRQHPVARLDAAKRLDEFFVVHCCSLIGERCADGATAQASG